MAVPRDTAGRGGAVHVRDRRDRERHHAGAGGGGGQGRGSQPRVDRGAGVERGVAGRGLGRAGARAARRRDPVLRRRGETARVVQRPARDRGQRGDAPDLHDQARALSPRRAAASRVAIAAASPIASSTARWRRRSRPRSTAWMCRTAGVNEGSPPGAAASLWTSSPCTIANVSSVPGWKGFVILISPSVPNTRLKVSYAATKPHENRSRRSRGKISAPQSSVSTPEVVHTASAIVRSRSGSVSKSDRARRIG